MTLLVKRSEAVTAQVKEEKDLIRGETDETTALAPVAEDVPTPAITAESLKEESPETKVDEASNEDDNGPKVLGKIDIEDPKPKKKESQKAEPKAKSENTSEETPKAEAYTSAAKETKAETEISTKYVKIDGPKFTGEKIELPIENPTGEKKKRVRIKKQGPSGATQAQADPQARGARGNQNKGKGRLKQPAVEKQELSDEEIQKQIKETLEKLTSGKKNKGAKIRRDKRAERREKEELADMQAAEESKVLKVTEFVTVTELANMMEVSVNDVIGSLMGVGVMVTMNQRLDAEMLEMVAEEFGFSVNFVDEEGNETFQEEEDKRRRFETTFTDRNGDGTC